MKAVILMKEKIPETPESKLNLKRFFYGLRKLGIIDVLVFYDDVANMANLLFEKDDMGVNIFFHKVKSGKVSDFAKETEFFLPAKEGFLLVSNYNVDIEKILSGERLQKLSDWKDKVILFGQETEKSEKQLFIEPNNKQDRVFGIGTGDARVVGNVKMIGIFFFSFDALKELERIQEKCNLENVIRHLINSYFEVNAIVIPKTVKIQ